MSADGIQFTVQEMLLQIQAEISEVNHKLDSKADIQSVMDARARLTALEREQDRREASYGSIAGKANQKEVDELDERVGNLTKALYTASLSVVGAVVVFLIQQGGFH